MSSHFRFRTVCLLIASAIVVQPACQDATGPAKRTPTALRIVPTSMTLDDGGTDSFSAVVLDQDGATISPLPTGLTIGWSSDAPSVASVAGGMVTANRPGETQVVATAGSLTASAAVTVRQVPAALAKVSGDEQASFPGAALEQKVAVRVLDRHGSAVSGVRVDFATADGGEVEPASVTSAGEGLAETTWTLGPGEGTQTLTAAVAGIAEPVSFTATASALPVARVVVTPEEAVITVASGLQLEAKLEDENGAQLQGRAVSWASADSAITRVSATGMVTARTPGGPVFVVAMSEGKADSARITVVPVSVAAVRVTPATASVAAGGALQLTATTTSAGGDTLFGRAVLWSSADSLVARVSTTGLVTGVAAGGPVSIRALSEGHRDSSRVTVLQAPVAAISVSPDSGLVQEGLTLQLTATVADASGNPLPQRPVSWTSADSTIARVSPEGLVTGVARGGPIAIVAESEGRRDTAWVRVFRPAVASVEVVPDAATLGVGETLELNAIAHDSAGGVLTGRPVGWRSSDSSVVSVTALGLLRARAAGGPVTITATVEGVRGLATVEVEAQRITHIYFSPAFVNIDLGEVVWVDILILDQDSVAVDVRGRSVEFGDAQVASGEVEIEEVVWEDPWAISPSASISGSRLAARVVAPAPRATRSGRARVRGVAAGTGEGYLTIDSLPEARFDYSVVQPIEIEDVSVSDGTLAYDTIYDVLELAVGERRSLFLEVAGEGRTGLELDESEWTATWGSSDSSIVAVTPSGDVRGIADGDATIVVTVRGIDGINQRSVRFSVAVRDQVAESISITPGSTTVMVGSTVRLLATAVDSEGADVHRPATWSASGAAASLESSGDTVTLVARSVGTATVVARLDDVAATAVVSIVPRAAFVEVSAGGSHACALTAAGAAFCWGSNNFGQLGVGFGGGGCGFHDCSERPVAVSGGVRFVQLAAASGHTCGLTAAGIAYCWGADGDGQLGDGGGVNSGSEPRMVAGGLTFSSIAAGVSVTCATTPAGAGYCWGNNDRGQIGDGTSGWRNYRYAPAAIDPALRFASIGTGGWHSCGMTTNGTALCWGDGFLLGSGDEAYNALPSPSPVPVAGGYQFSSLSVGRGGTCGITVQPRTMCWGRAPVEVLASEPLETISRGWNHTCALSSSGAPHCWGTNFDGQLGNGTTVASTTPVALPPGTPALASIDAGDNHTCGIGIDGHTYCWGANEAGQIGNGSRTDARVPTAVEY